MSDSLSALFNPVELVRHPVPGVLERVPLDHLQLAPNHRKAIDREAIQRLARMLAETGQLTPCIGRRIGDDRVLLYAGQRRLLAARASHELAGTPEFEGLAPVADLIVLLLDHEPGEDEIRRIQAQENAREPLSLRDQQEQFARLLAGPRRPARRRPHGRRLRRPRHQRRQGPQPAPPARPPGRHPRADRRAPRRRSALGADGASPRRHARHRPRAHPGRRRPRHHERAARPGAARPRRLRAPHRRRGRARLRRPDRRRRPARRRRAARARAPPPQRRAPRRSRRGARLRDRQARLRARRARRPRPQRRAQAARRRPAARPRRQRPLRLGVRPRPGLRRRHLGHRPGLHARRRPPAARRRRRHAPRARTPTSAARASTTTTCATPPKRTAGAAPPSAPATPRRRASNLGLGHDIRAALADPSDDQLDALREIVCRLLREHHPELIAYGAGWTDAERQQPVGDTGRREPRHVDAIVDAELATRARRPRPAARHRPAGRALGRRVSCSTPTASPGPRRSAPSAWRASCATRSPAASNRCAPPCGRSCDRSSPRGWSSSTRTPSSSTTGIESSVDLAAHRADSDARRTRPRRRRVRSCRIRRECPPAYVHSCGRWPAAPEVVIVRPQCAGQPPDPKNRRARPLRSTAANRRARHSGSPVRPGGPGTLRFFFLPFHG